MRQLLHNLLMAASILLTLNACIDEDEFDEFDDDKLTEESYRTTIEENPEDLSLEAADVADDDDL